MQEKTAEMRLGLPHAERIRLLAYELAEGVRNDMWTPLISVKAQHVGGENQGENWVARGHPNYKNRLLRYLTDEWKNMQPQASFLEAFGYFQRLSQMRPDDDLQSRPTEYILTQKAMMLISPAQIFISYGRNVSSAIAMLIWSELRAMGFSPFLDIRDIKTGDIWEAILEKQVQESNFFIIIIGQGFLSDPAHPEIEVPKQVLTTNSLAVRKEISWVLESPKNHRIITILHGGITAENLATSQEPFSFLAQYDLITLDKDTSPYLTMALENLKGIFQEVLR